MYGNSFEALALKSIPPSKEKNWYESKAFIRNVDFIVVSPFQSNSLLIHRIKMQAFGLPKSA